jgi:hypothetical protein
MHVEPSKPSRGARRASTSRGRDLTGAVVVGAMTVGALLLGGLTTSGCIVHTRSRGGYYESPPPRRGPPPHAPAHGYRRNHGRGRGTVEVR